MQLYKILAKTIFVAILLNFGIECLNAKEITKNKKEKEVHLKGLSELIELNNPELLIMQSKIKQAEYNLKDKVAAWNPSLSLSGDGLKYTQGNTYNNLSTDTSTKQWKSSLTASAEWDIINPSRNPDIAAAKDQLKKQKLAYEMKYRDVHLDGLNKFFMLQKSSENIRIAKQSVKTSQNNLKEAKIRFKSGVGTKLDVLEASSQLAKDNQFLTKSVGDYKINQRLLAKLINIDQDTNPIIKEEVKLIGVWQSSLKESILASYAYRKDLSDLLLDLSISNNNANSQLATSQPKFSLFNNFTTSFSKGEAAVVSPNQNNEIYSENNSFGIKFNWKIFDGGHARSNYIAKKNETEEIKSRFSLQKLQIRQEVEEDFFKLEVAKQNILNTYKEIKSSRESLRLALLKLNAGITTQREVVSNQRDLTQAEVNYILAITDYNMNLVKLRRQTGIQKIKPCSETNLKNDKIGIDRLPSLCKELL